jgi:hypothetical protein
MGVEHEELVEEEQNAQRKTCPIVILFTKTPV